MESKIISQAKKNLRDYKIIEKFVAGLVLTGNEVKSLRSHRTSISEAYVIAQHKELCIINMHIAAYKYSRENLAKVHDTRRKKKLLLKRREINKLIGTMKAKNYSLIPLKLFFNERGLAKLEIALAQRLRKYQLKEKIKERELRRDLKNEILY